MPGMSGCKEHEGGPRANERMGSYIINRRETGRPLHISLLQPGSNSSGGETCYEMEPDMW